MIARGRSRLGSLTSSPEVETASKPMYAKKIIDAAVTVPPKPSPSTKNGLKLSLLNAVMPSTMNSASTTSLIATMIVLARAVSRTPIISTAGDREHQERRGEVDRAALAGRVGERLGQRERRTGCRAAR